MPPALDRTGQVFGRLRVVGRCYPYTGRGHLWWWAFLITVIDCGGARGKMKTDSERVRPNTAHFSLAG